MKSNIFHKTNYFKSGYIAFNILRRFSLGLDIIIGIGGLYFSFSILMFNINLNFVWGKSKNSTLALSKDFHFGELLNHNIQRGSIGFALLKQFMLSFDLDIGGSGVDFRLALLSINFHFCYMWAKVKQTIKLSLQPE